MVIPTPIRGNIDTDDPYLSLVPSKMQPYLHKSIQQLTQRIVELEQRIEELENPA
jgi:hypothetical protein